MLGPAAGVILTRICKGKDVAMTSLSDSVDELLSLGLVYIESPNLIKPTQKGREFIAGNR